MFQVLCMDQTKHVILLRPLSFLNLVDHSVFQKYAKGSLKACVSQIVNSLKLDPTSFVSQIIEPIFCAI